jgi:hypothetical protein
MSRNNPREGSRKAVNSSESPSEPAQSTTEAQPKGNRSHGTLKDNREQSNGKVAERSPAHRRVIGRPKQSTEHQGAESIQRGSSRKAANSSEATGKPTQPTKQQPPGTRFEGALGKARQANGKPSQGSCPRGRPRRALVTLWRVEADDHNPPRRLSQDCCLTGM